MEGSKKRVVLWIAAVVFAIGLCGNAFALEWGTKELETEKLAVAFADQINKGGYKVVMTEELKGWIDKKEPMLIVDTMPFDSMIKFLQFDDSAILS